MKKLCSLFLISLFFIACGTIAQKTAFSKHAYDQYETKADFLNAIESGDADADSFVKAIKTGSLKLTDVSPEALANYYEAFANEGMLYQTPREYLTNEEIKISLEVVFESSENITMNREVYNRYLRI